MAGLHAPFPFFLSEPFPTSHRGPLPSFMVSLLQICTTTLSRELSYYSDCCCFVCTTASYFSPHHGKIFLPTGFLTQLHLLLCCILCPGNTTGLGGFYNHQHTITTKASVTFPTASETSPPSSCTVLSPHLHTYFPTGLIHTSFFLQCLF